MALKVKAVERLLKFDKESAGKYRYVMKPEMYSSLTQAKVIKEAALRSGVSQGVMKACWDAAGEVIKAWATEGHSVALLKPSHHLHPKRGPEGRAGEHRHPDYLLRPQRRRGEARDLDLRRSGGRREPHPRPLSQWRGE